MKTSGCLWWSWFKSRWGQAKAIFFLLFNHLHPHPHPNSFPSCINGYLSCSRWGKQERGYGHCPHTMLISYTTLYNGLMLREHRVPKISITVVTLNSICEAVTENLTKIRLAREFTADSHQARCVHVVLIESKSLDFIFFCVESYTIFVCVVVVVFTMTTNLFSFFWICLNLSVYSKMLVQEFNQWYASVSFLERHLYI